MLHVELVYYIELVILHRTGYITYNWLYYIELVILHVELVILHVELVILHRTGYIT